MGDVEKTSASAEAAFGELPVTRHVYINPLYAATAGIWLVAAATNVLHAEYDPSYSDTAKLLVFFNLLASSMAGASAVHVETYDPQKAAEEMIANPGGSPEVVAQEKQIGLAG